MKSALGLLAVGLLSGAVAPLAEEPPPRKKALVFPIEGPIDSGTEEDLREAVEVMRSREPHFAFLILRLDTPGGEVEAAQKIARLVYDLDVHQGIRTIAWVPKGGRAVSAGALIALACREIAMGLDTRLGDAAPVDLFMNELPEKIQSVVREDFETYARNRGRPVALAQAMVSKSYKVYRVTFEDGTQSFLEEQELDALPQRKLDAIRERELVDREGDLLMVDEKKAKEYGLADAIVLNFDDLRLRSFPGLADEDIIRYGETDVVPHAKGPLGALLGFLLHPFVRFLLIAGGVLGLFIEFNVPGFGAPGIIGIACFVIFFAAGMGAGQVGLTEILFFVLGMGLLLVELLLIPGFGVAGVLGILFLFASIVLSLQSFSLPRGPFERVEFERNLLTTIVSLGAGFAAALVAAHYMPRYPLLRRMGIVHDDAIRAGSRAEGEPDWVGREGLAVTDLRPAGKAFIGGRLVDVVTHGDFLPKGAAVVVVERQGPRTVVERRGT
ncbi:MAG: hypothetical protein JXP34_23205 [Planctomycetes bacterium]|nr:hypothetical protein [Planctomycetota bacterium]